jgi:predicted acyl esterase
VIADRRYGLAPNASAHPSDDAYWQDSRASAVSRIDVPVLGCQSWQDGVVSSRATEAVLRRLQPRDHVVHRHERRPRIVRFQRPAHDDGELLPALRGRRAQRVAADTAGEQALLPPASHPAL